MKNKIQKVTMQVNVYMMFASAYSMLLNTLVILINANILGNLP